MFLYKPKNSPNWYVGGIIEDGKKKAQPLHKFLRLSFPVRQKAVAQELLSTYRKQEISDRMAGYPAALRYLSIQEFYRAYSAYCEKNKARSTLRSETYKLRQWLTFLEKLKIRHPGHITKQAVTKFISEIRHLSNATINRHVSLIRASIRWGVQQGHLEFNPLRDFTRLTETRRFRIPEITAADRDKLFSVPDLQFRLFLQIVYWTLARKSEVLSLTWEDVDLQRKLISFHQTKTKRPRVIPIADALLEELRRIDNRNGKLFEWKAEYVSRKYQRLRDKLGLKPAGIHKLRHARASELLRNGANPRAVQEMLGHSTSRTTMEIYAFVSLDGLRETVNK